MCDEIMEHRNPKHLYLQYLFHWFFKIILPTGEIDVNAGICMSIGETPSEKSIISEGPEIILVIILQQTEALTSTR